MEHASLSNDDNFCKGHAPDHTKKSCARGTTQPMAMKSCARSTAQPTRMKSCARGMAQPTTMKICVRGTAQPAMMEEISEEHCPAHKEEINGLLQRMSIGQRMQK